MAAPNRKRTKTKVCTGCGRRLKREKFHRWRRGEDGRRPECKDCGCARYRKYYQENKQAKIESVKVRRREIRDWLRDIRAQSGCEECGEPDPACLEFHHRDPSKKFKAIFSMARLGYSREKIEDEVAKCAVLCANCHRKVHYTG